MGSVLSGIMQVWGNLPPSVQNEVKKKIPSEVLHVHQIVNSILNPPTNNATPQESRENEDKDVIEVEWTEAPRRDK